MKELNERKLEELCEFIGNRVCIRCGDWFDYPIECRTKSKCNPNCPFRTKENVLKWLETD